MGPFNLANMAAVARTKQVPAWLLKVKKWAYYKSYFPQLGLMTDDCIYADRYVKEAVKRLPNDVRQAREFRMGRALILSHNKDILPKEEWTKWEEDQPYLNELIEEVKKEERE